MSTAHLDAFARGQIHALRAAGWERPSIARSVTKRDGSHLSLRAIDGVLQKKRLQPGWRGEDSSAGGRPPALTKKERKQLVALVFKERARLVVTVTSCRKRLPSLRLVCDQTVRNALHDAGLAWLRRRAECRRPVSLDKTSDTVWIPFDSLEDFSDTVDIGEEIILRDIPLTNTAFSPAGPLGPKVRPSLEAPPFGDTATALFALLNPTRTRRTNGCFKVGACASFRGIRPFP